MGCKLSGAGATTPESPVRSELHEAIEVLENNCANLDVPEAEISIEYGNSRLNNNGPMLPSSETNPAESSKTKDAEGIQLQNNPVSRNGNQVRRRRLILIRIATGII